jgi:hypothetical protein
MKLEKKNLKILPLVEQRYQTFMLDGLYYKINNGGNITRRKQSMRNMNAKGLSST